MLGTKIYKPVESKEQLENYISIANWCNENGYVIEDKGDFYEVVENTPAEELPAFESDTPTLEQRINDIELALMELAGDL